MTLELTLPRTPDAEHRPRHLKRLNKMVYTMDEGQLFRVWTVIRFLSEMRETEDPIAQSEILTDAQILLTAFVLDLQPLPGGRTNLAKFGTNPAQTVKLDA
jgi:hypothetical protein